MFNVVLSHINFKYAHPNMEKYEVKSADILRLFFGLFLDGFRKFFDLCEKWTFKQKKT